MIQDRDGNIDLVVVKHCINLDLLVDMLEAVVHAVALGLVQLFDFYLYRFVK